MESKINEYHNFLNRIYVDAEKLFNQIIELKYKASLNSYNNHYISINGKYENQRYYMPVISIENQGDICFNLDGICFEFYIDKEKLIKLNKLEELLKCNNLNIYEYEDCTKDLYINGNTKNELIEKVSNSKDTKFGISVDCSHISKEKIVDYFNKVCNLLDI